MKDGEDFLSVSRKAWNSLYMQEFFFFYFIYFPRLHLTEIEHLPTYECRGINTKEKIELKES